MFLIFLYQCQILLEIKQLKLLFPFVFINSISCFFFPPSPEAFINTFEVLCRVAQFCFVLFLSHRAMFMDFRLWTLCLNKLSEINRIRKLVFTFLSLIIFIRKIRFLFSLRQTFHRFYHFQFICQIECKVRGSISGFLFYCCQDKSKHLTLETLFFHSGFYSFCYFIYRK